MQSLLGISGIIEKYIRTGLDEEEQVKLNAWLGEDEANAALFRQLTDEHVMKQHLDELDAIDIAKGWNAFQERKTGQETNIRDIRKARWWKYAAAILLPLVIASGMLFFNKEKQDNDYEYTPTALRYHNDVEPGGNKAVLILSNGEKVILDGDSLASLGERDGARLQNDSARLVYEKGFSQPGEVVFNTLTTPVGGTYSVVLSDGTRIWLNAMSSIRYPTHFTGSERTVFLKGEAYFEVARNVHQRFIVETAEDVRIEVLGTHFNVMAYNNEKEIVTTLLEGQVQLKYGSSSPTYNLRPGFHAVFNKQQQLMDIARVDVDGAVAWKNNLFLFNNDNLEDIMKQLERWYDITVEYKLKTKPKSHFTGGMRRMENISKVLEMLELTGGAHFEIEGRRIIVTSP
ncbi:FecR domain-containing protein [Chitinophaga sp. MM2321]|uniref:FecR family protein n=1 Tax=Chitinophaga sp. MM2321 TaxID=3137178 RepID=UPI0032D596B6